MRVSWLLHAALITHLVFHVRATCDVESYKKCDSPKKYHCQYEASNDTHVEFCAIPIWCNAGNHTVLDNVNKSVTCEECAEGMFQPEGKYSNIFIQPNCDQIVTSCNEKEMVCENATTTQNTKCACNETAGYKLKENQNCKENCFPSWVCECELPVTQSTQHNTSTPPGLENETTTTATQTSTLEIWLPIVVLSGVLSIAVIVYYCKRRKTKRNDGNKEEEEAVTDSLVQPPEEHVALQTPPIRDTETDETDESDGRRKGNKGGTNVTGLTDNARAEKVNTTGTVYGDVDKTINNYHIHYHTSDAQNPTPIDIIRRTSTEGQGVSTPKLLKPPTLSNANDQIASTSGEEKAQKSDIDQGENKAEDKDQGDQTINVTGVSGSAAVHSAYVAGVVYGGMDNDNRSAPLASRDNL